MTSKCKKGCGFKSKIKDLNVHEKDCKGAKEPVLKEEVKNNQKLLEESPEAAGQVKPINW
jgi:hypothetical protein